MPGAAIHRDRGHERAAGAEPRRQARRLGDDPCVGPHARGRHGERARAGRLLVGDRADHEIAPQRNLELAQHLGGKQHRGHAALHVARSAAEQPSVAHLRRERRAGPSLARLGRHDVDVAVEQQVAPAAGPARPGHQLRPAAEVMTVGDRIPARRQLGHLGLPHPNRQPRGAQPCGNVILQRRLVARRVIRVRRTGVEGDEIAQQADQLVLSPRHLRDDALLQGRQVGGHRATVRERQSRCAQAPVLLTDSRRRV